MFGRKVGWVIAIVLLFGWSVPGCSGPDRQRLVAGELPKRSLFTPKGAPWTILCVEIKGAARKEHIEQLAGTLKQTPGVDAGGVFTRHDEDGFSRLYYGVYYRRTNPTSGKRTLPKKLIRDLEMLKQLGTPDGKRYFLAARMVRLPLPDVGNPAWALSRAKGLYTLQVAVFEPTDEHWNYKAPAAALCDYLRKNGHQAFYYYGGASSSVTVGVFGAEALIPQPLGLPKYSAAVRRLQESDEFFKYNHLNGAVYSARSDRGEMLPVPSRLVRIPKQKEPL